jgi:hypothetical protein
MNSRNAFWSASDGLESERDRLVGGLKSYRVVRIINQDGLRQWLKLSEYAAQLSREDWQEVT